MKKQTHLHINEVIKNEAARSCEKNEKKQFTAKSFCHDLMKEALSGPFGMSLK